MLGSDGLSIREASFDKLSATALGKCTREYRQGGTSDMGPHEKTQH